MTRHRFSRSRVKRHCELLAMARGEWSGELFDDLARDSQVVDLQRTHADGLDAATLIGRLALERCA